MANKASLDNALRGKFLKFLKDCIEAQYETDVLPVSASEFTVPCLDDEGNEKYVLIKVSIPRGTRNGEGGYDPYDGYAASEAYKDEVESKAHERAVKKAMKEAEKGKKKDDGEK